MGSEAQNIWDWIETNLLGDAEKKLWTNTASYGSRIDEDHMDEMVQLKFGGYGKWLRFTNGTTQYKVKVLPLQNKHTRDDHAYSTYHGGENMVNLIARPARGGEIVFNLHIQVRRLATAQKYRQKHAVSADGWSTK